MTHTQSSENNLKAHYALKTQIQTKVCTCLCMAPAIKHFDKHIIKFEDRG